MFCALVAIAHPGAWQSSCDLRELLRNILPQKTAFQNFRVEHDFPRIGPKILLLNARRLTTSQNETQSILLAMEDITGRP